MGPETDREDELDRVAEEFVAQLRSGASPSPSEYADRHPALADDIRSLFPLLGALEGPHADALAPGARLGPYEIVREIGRGGMGVVYEARQTDLGRHVALKLLPVQAGLDARFRERFRQEAQGAARLSHPHIVPVIGAGEHAGVLYFTMQYVRGRSLDTLREEVRTLLATGSAAAVRRHHDRVARLGLQAAEAVAHAHAHGVLHRDIKPANVLLEGDDHVWITDFGLCRLAGSDDLTRTGDVLGTFRYLPPERFSGVSDVRGDVYGLGATLYELLTGRRAYEEDDPAALAARIPREPPPRPRHHDPRIPSDLETIVRTAMAHDPRRRYATAEALALDLRAYVEGRPIAARAPTLMYLMRRAMSRHRALTATAAAALALLIGSGLWYVADLRRSERTARRGQYVAQVAGVESALRGGDVHAAAALLHAAPVEFRRWEWHHLRSRLERHVRLFETPGAEVLSVDWAPGGDRFAVAAGREVWIYEDVGGAVRGRLTPAAPPTCVCWSREGGHLAVSTVEGIELWSWPASERLWRSGRGEHRSIAFVEGGTQLVAAALDGRLLRYGVGDGAEQRSTQLDARVLAMDLRTEDGVETIVLGDAGGRIRVLEASVGEQAAGEETAAEERWSAKVSASGVHSVACLPGARVAACFDGAVRLWDARTGSDLGMHALGGHVHGLVRDPQGRRLLVLGEGRLHVLEATGGSMRHVLAGNGGVRRAAVHPEGRRLLVAGVAGPLAEWYLGSGGDPLALGTHLDDVLAAAFSPDGRLVASGGFGGILHVWDREAGELMRACFGHRGAITSVAFLANGEALVSTDDAGHVRIHDALGERVLATWQAHEGPGVLAVGGPGRDVYTFSRDGLLRRWNPPGTLAAEAQHVSEQGPGGTKTRRLAASPDGAWVATGDDEGGIRIWTSDTLQPVVRIKAHEREVTGLAFDATGARLASVSQDQTLSVWDPATGTLRCASAPFDPGLGWSAGLQGVCFHPDGMRLATGSYSGVVRLWDPEDAVLLLSLDQGSWISDLSFSRDGAHLLTALASGDVRLCTSALSRSLVAALERARARTRSASPTLKLLLERHATPAAALRALDTAQDVGPEVAEGVRRALHARSVAPEALEARAWEDLTRPDAEVANHAEALALASGLWRAAHHQERPYPGAAALLALALFRTGAPQKSLDVLQQVAERHARTEPRLHALEVAIAALAHERLGAPTEAEGLWDRLEDLLQSEPDARSPRLERLRSERPVR